MLHWGKLWLCFAQGSGLCPTSLGKYQVTRSLALPAAGASRWCMRQKSMRNSNGKPGPILRPGLKETGRIGDPLSASSMTYEIGRQNGRTLRPSAATRPMPSAGTSAVTLRWNFESGLPPSSLYRYQLQGASQEAPPCRVGQQQRNAVIGIRSLSTGMFTWRGVASRPRGQHIQRPQCEKEKEGCL